MVEDAVKKYTEIVEDLRDISGLKFFSVLKMDELTDRWTFLFGLTGVKDLDKRQKVFIKIREIIVRYLNAEDMQDVARIGIFSTTDHLVKDLIKFPEGEKVENIKANGNFIHEGYILIGKKER